MNKTSSIKSLREFKETGRTVLLRTDFNVDLEHGKIVDDQRIKAALPTIQYLSGLGAKQLIISHLGRPQGQPQPELSLRPVAQHLAELLQLKFVDLGDRPSMPDYPLQHVYFFSGNIRTIDRAFTRSLKPGDVLVFENIRFYAEEEDQNPVFTKKLSELADVYVNEAFSVSHHPAASVTGLPQHLPAYAGLQLSEEIKNLNYVATTPNKPFTVVIGGAKITDKAKMLSTLLPKCDHVLVGGAMANIFLQARNFEIGDSYVEKEGLHLAFDLIRNYKDKILLPTDVMVGRSLAGKGQVRYANQVRQGEKILDIGPETTLFFSDIIKKSNTIIWNGPMGYCENEFYSHGTMALARLMASRARGKAYVLVGGGETIIALNKTGLSEHIDFVSTGGGAMLSYLGNKALPGIEALSK